MDAYLTEEEQGLGNRASNETICAITERTLSEIKV